MYRNILLIAVTCGLTAATCPDVAAADRHRPNVLWICADDLAAYTLGAYGNRLAHTPNIDRLAAEGIRFDGAYCNSPVCTASRQSFLTGRYPRSIGVTQLKTALPESETTLAEMLSAAGYRTAAIGKMHFNSKLKHGFEVRLDLPDYQRALKARGRRPLPAGVAVQPPWRPFKDAASVWLNSACVPVGLADDDMSGTWLAEQAVDYLRHAAEGPFFLMVSFYEPHSPFVFPVEYRGRRDPKLFQVPPVAKQDEWQVPAIFRDLTDEQKQGIAAAYYTSAEFADKNIGLVLDALRATGHDRDTLVVLTGDHGYMLGQHGRFEKHCSYEPAVRAPLMMRLPDGNRGGRACEALVEFIDVVPTLLEHCGVEVPAAVQGRSLSVILDGQASVHRDHVIVEYSENEEAMIRDERYKLVYITGRRQREDGYATREPLRHRVIQLFDEQLDPDELENLAEEPAHADRVESLLSKLADHLRRTARQPELLPNTDDRLAFIDACLAPHDVPAAVDSAAVRSEARPRPNVLWITCEDMSPNLGCYGDNYAITPRLDQLAAESIRYTHAFSVAGVCAPSRSCLITGMYPSTIGSQHMRCTTRLPDFIQCFPEYLRAAGYYCTNNSKEDYNFKTPRAAWDESSPRAHWRKRAAGQPFFAVFNLTITHESQIRLPDGAFAKRTASLAPNERHDPAKAPIPAWQPDTPVVRRDWARYYDLITAMDKQAGDLLDQLAADGLSEDTIVFFFSDHGVGLPRGKRWLYDSGMRVPLLVRFPKRHRAGAPGEPGTTCDRLVSFVDFAPTILSLAGVDIPRHLQGAAFLGQRAAAPREYVYGIRDRMDERYDLTRAVRDARWKYIRNYRPELPYAQPLEYMDEMPTMREWRRLAAEGKLTGPAGNFMRPTKPVEELYDTQADPAEIQNLAADEAYREVLERLRSAHSRWIDETHDLGFLPEAEIWRRAGDGTPYDLAHDPVRYPRERIVAAATRPEANAAHLAAGLADDDAAVRWWALVRFQRDEDNAEKSLPLLVGAAADPAPSVSMAAAEILCQMGRLQKGLAVLKAGLLSDRPYVRLDAANRLDQLGELARPLHDLMTAALKDSNGDVQKVMRHALR